MGLIGGTRLGLALLAASVAVTAHGQDASPAADALRPAVTADAEAAAQREADLKRRVEASRREMERLSATIRLSDEKREALEAAVSRIEGDAVGLRNEAVRAAEERARLEAALDAAADRLAVLGAREQELLDDLAGRRDVLAEVLGALQRMGRNPPPALLISPEDALGSVRSAVLMGAVVPALREEAEKLVADLTSLKRVRERLVAEREDVRERLVEIAEGEERLALVSRTKRELLERTGRDLEAERARAAELAARAGTLEELTGTLNRELAEASAARSEAEAAAEQAERDAERAEREAAIAAADALRRAREAAEALSARPAPEPPAPEVAALDQGDEPAEPVRPAERTPLDAYVAPGVFAEADPAREKPAFAFASLGGKLDLPVRGRIESGFGRGDALRSKGLVVEGRPGGLVRAPTDGWVVFAGPFRSYGEIVILSVGDDYRMVLAGLDSSDVALGQFLLAGEPMGRLGKVGNGGPGGASAGAASLYVEVRSGDTPVDPARWFAPVQTAERADG